MTDEIEAPTTNQLMISIQRALLGEVGDNLFAVTVGYRADTGIDIDSYFIGPVSEQDWLGMSSVSAEVCADFPGVRRVESNVFNALELGETRMRDFWAFQRRRDSRTNDIGSSE